MDRASSDMCNRCLRGKGVAMPTKDQDKERYLRGMSQKLQYRRKKRMIMIKLLSYLVSLLQFFDQLPGRRLAIER